MNFCKFIHVNGRSTSWQVPGIYFWLLRSWNAGHFRRHLPHICLLLGAFLRW